MCRRLFGNMYIQNYCVSLATDWAWSTWSAFALLPVFYLFFFFFFFCIDSVQRCRPATAITQLMRLPLLTSRLILPVAKPSPRGPTWKMRTCFVYFDCAVVAVSASIALPLLLRSGISPLFDVFVALAQLCRHVVHLKCSSSSSKSKVALLSTFLDHLLTVPRIKL